MMSQTTTTRICAAIFLLYAAALYATAGRMQGWPGTGTTVAQSTAYVDYVAIWTAGKQVIDGDALGAYDWAEHGRRSFELLERERSDYQPWPYPPIYLAVAALFALMPYGVSMLMWVIASYAVFAAVAARIIGTPRGAIWMAISIPALYNAMVGQNGAVSAALLGAGLVMLPTRPILAGVCLGLLSYKPHIGVLIPIALAAAGYWRTFASAAATVVVLMMASALVFGSSAWLAFFSQMPLVADLVLHRRPEILQSAYGMLVTSGAGAGIAMTVQVGVALAAAAGIAWLWRRDDVAFDCKAAALAAATLFLSPYQFVYDFSILMVAQAFLLRSVMTAETDEREIDGIVLANAIIAVSPGIGFPTAPLAAVLLIALIVRRLGAAHRVPANSTSSDLVTRAA
ncbi:MAG: glycosyltransferase family 87 protein [Hyphomicrobium sp.]